MHFALPPRKSSFPPPYAKASARSATNQKRKSIQLLSYVVLGLLTVYLVGSWLWTTAAPQDNGTVPKDSSVLIVTVLDESSMSEDYIRIIKANRDDYAARHGYKTWYTNMSTYEHLTNPSPSSWSLIPALRHAITLHPEVDYVWSLTPHAMITNVTLDFENHIFTRLPSLMRKEIPVVPPDSVIHTFSHIRPSHAYLILSQDIDNLAHTSLILRNTRTIPVVAGGQKDTWTEYFLDVWFDPLYRSYAFQKAENHALEHIVQWHPTILAKLVIVDQRVLNSYNFQSQKMTDPNTHTERTVDSMWQPGDFIVNLKGCMEANSRNCEKELRVYFAKWEKQVEAIDGKTPQVTLGNRDYTFDSAKHTGESQQAKDAHQDARAHI